MVTSPSLIPNLDAFLSKITVGSDSQCWPWTGCTNRAGYGVFHTDRQWLSHRLSLMLSGVKVEEDDRVLHSCDNPPCCNPNHLRTGNQLDNMRDAIARNRVPRGESRPNSKLSEEMVNEIRMRYKGGESQKAIAASVGVSQPTVSKVATRKIWTHV